MEKAILKSNIIIMLAYFATLKTYATENDANIIDTIKEVDGQGITGIWPQIEDMRLELSRLGNYYSNELYTEIATEIGQPFNQTVKAITKGIDVCYKLKALLA